MYMSNMQSSCTSVFTGLLLGSNLSCLYVTSGLLLVAVILWVVSRDHMDLFVYLTDEHCQVADVEARQ